MDLRGHGASPTDRSIRFTRIRHYVDDVATVIDSLSEDPIVVAHSMGGLIVQRLLETRDLPHAVLLASVPIGGVGGATFRFMRRHPVKFAKVNLLWDLKPIVEDRRIAQDVMLSPELDPEEADTLWPRMQSDSYIAFLEMLMVVRPRPQLVNTPVTIVAGSADRLFSVRSQRRLAQAYGVDAHIIDGASHDLMLDPRWQQVAEIISQELEP